MQDVCDRIAILYKGELKELGRVDTLLKVRDVTEIHTSTLSEEALAEIRQVVARHQGSVHSVGNPTQDVGRFVHPHHSRERGPSRSPRARRRG